MSYLLRIVENMQRVDAAVPEEADAPGA